MESYTYIILINDIQLFSLTLFYFILYLLYLLLFVYNTSITPNIQACMDKKQFNESYMVHKIIMKLINKLIFHESVKNLFKRKYFTAEG